MHVTDGWDRVKLPKSFLAVNLSEQVPHAFRSNSGRDLGDAVDPKDMLEPGSGEVVAVEEGS